MSISEKKGAELTPERKEYLKKTRRDKAAVAGAKILLLVALLVLWEVATRMHWMDAFITSSPSRIVKTITSLYRSGDLFRHVGITTLEAVIGFLSGTVAGTLIAALLWSSGFVSRVLEPYLVVLNSLPKIALGPIFIVWIGPGPASIIVITLTISLIVAILEVLNGFLSSDAEQIKLVRTFGGSKTQIFTKVVLPSNIPTIISSLKINVGMSWVGVIVGEFLVSKAGLGYLIVYGSQVFQLDLVMASVMILAVVATVMYQIVVWVEKLLIKH